MNHLNSKAWKLRRAWSAIEEYFRGIKGRASGINWVLGVLRGSLGVSKEEALMVVDQLRKDVTFVWDSNRLKRLEELEERIKGD